MALFLAAPAFAPRTAPAQYKVFWGDVHGHSANSDGKGTPAEYFLHARDAARLDFVILTDHDFGNGPPWRMPTNVWRAAQDTADALTVDGRFVAIAGYEWTSQPKYWTDSGPGSENLFPGAPRGFNHKNVYFPGRVDYLFSAKDAAFHTPDQLAEAVRKAGGLVHNNHPDAGPGGRDQFAYSGPNAGVIVNTEIMPDIVRYRGTNHAVNAEITVRDFLDHGGKTGLVGGSDTHDGAPAARTAVLARDLTREAIFDALRHRRNYAVSHARIGLDVRINGHFMGEDIETAGAPDLVVEVEGTDRIEELLIIRDGKPLHRLRPGTRSFRFAQKDETFSASSYYFVRVTQADADEHGNPSRAWSSPIWVKRSRSGGS